MAEPSRELLDQPSKPSLLDTLLLGNKHQEGEEDSKRRPLTMPTPKSQVLGRVKDFLGEMAKANEKLKLDLREQSPADFDIEVLTGNEREYIEMDLLLGVADLHTAEAEAAAEAAMNGFRPLIQTGTSSSSSTDDDSDEDDGDNENGNLAMSKLDVPEKSDSAIGDTVVRNRPKKRPKIIELN
uniref:Uncharacterized protein n=1 Tax=Ananas comosus var. bracteatus TaxID=296719 RepID=A0A6V7QU59_ANACO